MTAVKVGGNPYNSGDFTSINHLYINQGGRKFTESAAAMGVKFTGWGWGTAFLDIENDGDPDLLATNGIIDGGLFAAALNDPTYLLRHNGTTYDDVSAAFEITDNAIGRSVMVFDYNNDGKEDALITNVVGPRSLYRNDTPSAGNHWLRLRFNGTASNRDGYGTLVRATVGSKTYTGLYCPTNSYIGQREPLLHFGLGTGTLVNQLEIRWPSGTVQTLNNVAVDQILSLTEPVGVVSAPVITGQPASGTFAKNSNVTLAVVATGAPAPVYVWYKNGIRISGANGSSYTIKKIHPFDAGSYTVAVINRAGTALSLPAVVAVSIDLTRETTARWWNEALLDAIRKDVPNPPVHARNLYSLSAAMWDAYWAYEPGAWNSTAPAFHREIVPPSAWTPTRQFAQNEAISYAAFRILMERFKNSAGKVRTEFGNRWLMQQMGYDPDFTGTIGSSPAAIGNRIGYAILAAMVNDGANEANGYADLTGYLSANTPLKTAVGGNTMADMNRWQPLDLAFTVTQNGIVLPPAPQPFIGVNARNTTPFAIAKPTPTTLPASLDPGPQPMIGTATQARYVDEVVEVIRYSSMLDPADDVMIDISPGALLNNPLGTNDGTGHLLNPVTNLPYSSNIVKRGDYARILSEYWADGPRSETPPGHWNVIFNEINDHPLAHRRVGGVGPELSALEWEIRGYMALNGAVHDAACAAWLVKRQYDGPRPISMIRAMATLGQSTLNPNNRYYPRGLPLVPGLIELVTLATVTPGQRHAHLAPWAGNAIAIKTWKGTPSDPINQTGGVGWILSTNWIPYQLDTFVSPAFPGYVSGHSTFSAAAAVVLHELTGSAFFPGGMASRTFPANSFLTFEKGPSQTTQLQWATYYDAADQAGLSRLYGGIHVAADDFEGRKLGRKLGASAYVKIKSMLNYTPTSLESWRDINFSDPTNTGPGANGNDAIGDGTANLLKYALGLSAFQNAHDKLPTLHVQGDDTVFKFIRYPQKSDINYHVEVSADLMSWTEIASSQAGGVPQIVNGGALAVSEQLQPAGGYLVSVTDSSPANPTLPRFFRLAVTTP
ncbi:MAG: phosphatase PAP2 family protein [Verrucomicrobia bacterium]|nr:MAG: phosphatase PAP2 family protein [Verrucomicrobiota bacterium]